LKNNDTPYFSTKICLFLRNGANFWVGAKMCPIAQVEGSANRRSSVFPSAGGAAEPKYRVF